LPESDEAWLDRFLDGFLELAAQHRMTLIGGDTTQGPLSICVTVHGLVEPGRALRRAGAQVGDDIWVTGTLGDAAAALALLSGPAVDASSPHDARLALEALRQRLDRPIPRVAVGRALAGIAHACIDISDGLLADLDHVCEASGVGMRVALADLPASEALCETVGADARAGLQATGGDDYELCFTASPDARDALGRAAAETGVAFTRIGEVVSGERVRAFDGNKCEWQPPHTGYIHFAD
jgi:thiamine-monophosphate kinase